METSSFASTVVERPTTSPPPEHPASRAGRVGFFLFFREGAIADPTMLERAVAFRAAVDGLEPGAMRGRAVLTASQALFGDMPQTWAVWESSRDLAVKRAPDEIVTFPPHERPQLGRWIFDHLGRGGNVAFLIPLEGPGRVSPPSGYWGDLLWSLEAIVVE
jgi:hypothetical protein